MNISADKKVDVLIAVFESRLSQIQQIRNRSISMLLWVSAIFIFIAGHLISQKLVIDLGQKVGISLVLIISVSMISVQLNILYKGFHNHLEILVKTEAILGLYTKGAYHEETIFPERWKQSTHMPEFFKFIYISIGLIALLLLSLIWLSEWWF